MAQKNFVKKAIDKYKSKRRVKKLLKSGNQPEQFREDGTPEYRKGGKLKRKVKKYNLGGFIEKASPFFGAAGMIANKFAKKKKGGTIKYKRGGQFNQYD